MGWKESLWTQTHGLRWWKIISTQSTPAHRYSSDQRPWFGNGSPIAQINFAPELFMHIVDICKSICKHNSNNIIIIEKKCNTKRKIQLLSILYCKSHTCIECFSSCWCITQSSFIFQIKRLYVCLKFWTMFIELTDYNSMDKGFPHI